MSSGDWYIRRLVLKTFRNYEDLEIAFGREVTLLIGGNGARKESILDGAAAALRPAHTGLSSGLESIPSGHRPLVMSFPWDQLQPLPPSDARQIPSDLDSVRRTSSMETSDPVCIGIDAVIEGGEQPWSIVRRGEDRYEDDGAKSVNDHCINQGSSARQNAPKWEAHEEGGLFPTTDAGDRLSTTCNRSRAVDREKLEML